MREDELFAHFERMRRQLDELFGDSWERVGVASQRRRGFSPRVDVYYSDNPPAANITVDLAGVNVDDVTLEVQGRKLVIAGERRLHDAQQGLYQQIEIEHGPFRRVVELGMDVVANLSTATYEEGLLRIVLPLAQPEKVELTPVKKKSGAAKSGGNR